MSYRSARQRLRSVVLSLAVAVGVGPAVAHAAPAPFVTGGSTSLAHLAPGQIIATRTTSAHLFGLTVPIRMVQLQYRSEDQLGRPAANVTSVLLPPRTARAQEVVAYQSFYDSLDPADSPSRALAGATTLGAAIPSLEHALLVTLVMQGHTVVVTDTEGPDAHLIAAPEYGKHTLNGLRAALASPLTGLGPKARVALMGYSGGALATEWAAELAPTYAPEINQRLVGAAMGGVLADPLRNLDYVSGTPVWSFVLGLAIVGLDRSFGVDLRPALNGYGQRIWRTFQKASILTTIAGYPGLSWKQIARPEFPTPASVPGFAAAAHQLKMGQGGPPTIPLFIAQGTRGDLEGTPGNRPGLGPGDGIAIAGDVRELARTYCNQGLPVSYREYRAGHIGAMIPWAPAATRWVDRRFDGLAAETDCARIPEVAAR